MLSMEKHLARFETHLYVASLQTIRSTLITGGSFFALFLLFIIGEFMLGDPTLSDPANFGILLGMIIFVLRRYGSRARAILNEGYLRVTVPLLGDMAFNLESFEGATVSEPEVPSWIFETVLFGFSGLLLILEVYHFFSGVTVDGRMLLFAIVFLALAFQMHQQRDYKKLKLWFGVHSDWRRHLWSQRTITLHGKEEVLLQLKRQVEAAAGQGGE